MSFGWVDRIGPYDVERMEGRRPGGQPYLPLGDVRLVIGHTTEGSSVDGAVGTLRANFSAPHFVIGQQRIVQMRPGTAQAATVRGDNSRAWQVETVGFSQQHPHSLTQASWEPWVALARWFHQQHGVPLATVSGWNDDLSDVKTILAIEGNTRRVSRKALSHKGFVMHLDWPENTHWDMGAFRWGKLFEAIGGDDVAAADEIIEGNRMARSGKKLPDSATQYTRWGYAEGQRHMAQEKAIDALKARVKKLEDAPGGGGLTLPATVVISEP